MTNPIQRVLSVEGFEAMSDAPECIFCPHRMHLHACPKDGCLCDNQGRTETMQERRAQWEQQRQLQVIRESRRLAYVTEAIRVALLAQLPDSWLPIDEQDVCHPEGLDFEALGKAAIRASDLT